MDTNFTYRILLVDDDASLMFAVATKLRLAGYEVFSAGDGREALQFIDRFGLPHLAIVDIRMPVMDGLAFCRHVLQYSDLPIILLTAVDEEEVMVEAIRHYAEDYLTKPFSVRELEVRVERVLRRIGDFSYAHGPTITVDAQLSLDFAHQRVLRNQAPIQLTDTESKILYLLVRNANRPVTRDYLVRRLWPFEEVFEESLRVHIFNLRQKLEPDPRHPVYVVTERGIGYRFNALDAASHHDGK
jgi:DNA-binding response OmpR family regulator